VATNIPTQVGDVLILETVMGVKVFAVGPVIEGGQQHFHGKPDVRYLKGREAAVAAAKTLLQPGGRIYLLKLDSGTWAEIPR
jgi:hypothetical protein